MTFLDRYLYVRITSAEPEELISKLSFSGIDIWDMAQIDFLTVEIKIRNSCLRRVQNLAEKNGGTCKIIKKEGHLWKLDAIFKRPVLICGIILFFAISLFVPERIFFVTVTGNETIPEKQILSHAEECGIHFAAKASLVRSEDVKNKILSRLPELQWIGVTTSGSVADIQVKERSKQNDSVIHEDSVCSIVAARDGVITGQTVYRGNPLFQVGQKVNKGDVLISGYTDCGIILKAEQASGEVFGHTMRHNTFVSPLPSKIRGSFLGKRTCYRLQIGKKVINLCNHSGILDGSCDKIYSQKYWILPGGFQLPVSIVKVEHLFFAQVKPQPSDLESFQWLERFAQDYVKTQMISGVLLDEELQWELSDDVCVLTGEYACHEMIGQVKYEENLAKNAEDSGTNS